MTLHEIIKQLIITVAGVMVVAVIAATVRVVAGVVVSVDVVVVPYGLNFY